MPSSWKSCRRKKRHPTEADARAHLERLIAKGAHRPRLHIYKCACGGYHVGHRPHARRHA
jgi:hypothetical protein